MKTLRVGVALLGAALLVLAYSSSPQAFHSGGVAECVGCHSMHSPAPNGSHLLTKTDASSTCLNCHENAGDTGPSSYHVSTADVSLGAGASPLQRTPGGDFGWLKKDYASGSYSEDGATHGHNVVAADFGYVVDPENATSPGGSYPSAQLSCASCHDPHGRYRRFTAGNVASTGLPIKASGSYPAAENEPTATEAVGVYRLLAGPGYETGNVSFTGVPAAKVPSSYNQGEAVNQVRVAYGRATTGGHQAWGEWCGTCHQGMHSSTNYVHPVDENLGSEVAANYNAYVKTGDMTGNQATAFTSLVPFVENTNSYSTLASHAVNDNSVRTGPAINGTDQVSCLSCHRAHASGMLHALRFDMEYEFMTKESKYIGSDNTAVTGSRAAQQHRGRTMAEWQAAYYDRPATQFATYQRVLCNKCHQKD